MTVNEQRNSVNLQVVLLLLMFFMRKRVALTISLFHVAGKVFIHLPFLVLQPFWTFFCLMLFWVYWITVLLFLGTAGWDGGWWRDSVLVVQLQGCFVRFKTAFTIHRGFIGAHLLSTYFWFANAAHGLLLLLKQVEYWVCYLWHLVSVLWPNSHIWNLVPVSWCGRRRQRAASLFISHFSFLQTTFPK